MVTFTDSPIGKFPTFEAFIAARRLVRGAAAEQIAALRRDRSDAIASLEQHFAKVAAETRAAKAGLLSGPALTVELKFREHQERSAIKAQYDHKISEIYARYALKRNGKAQTPVDVRDYHHAAEMHRQDLKNNPQATVDFVLQQLPGVRRRRENGWMVYESPMLYGALGQRELLRCDDSNVVVRGADDDRIRTGLLLAAQRYAPPIRIDGTPEFVRRSRAIADSIGIAYEVQTETKEQHAQPAQPPTRNEPQESVESPTAGKYAIMPSDERLEVLKSELGVSFAAALSKLSKHIQEGKAVRRISSFWPDADGVVVLVGGGALVVPVEPSLTVELEQQVRISQGDGGRFVLESVSQERSEPAADVTDEEREQTQPVVVHARGQGR